MAQTAVLESPAGEDLEQRFEAFVASHRERAVRLAWRLVGGDDAAAEDVAQEAFVAAYRALGRFRGEAQMATWFHRILVRKAHDHRRWRALRRLWGAAPTEHDELRDPRPRPEGDPALRRRIAEALDRLSQRQREVFVLVHLEGFSVRETATLLGAREGTIKSHLHRALVQLRERLAELAGDGDRG